MAFQSASQYLNLKYPGWNVGKTIKNLLENASQNTTHKCAKSIRQALQAGGIETSGNPVKAQEYHTKNFLSHKNFLLVDTLETQQDIDKYVKLPGDIAVMYAPTGDTGHICLWTGSEWISDFVQKSIRPYTSIGTNPATIWIYRWDGYKYLENNA